MSEPVTLERQIACVRRELTMRRKVYPKWIAGGRMTQEQAQEQISTMEAVQATLEQLLAQRKAQVTPELF